jgi:hypothetical protein
MQHNKNNVQYNIINIIRYNITEKSATDEPQLHTLFMI